MSETKKDKDVRVRFAPSPTGPFHVGGARTALFNWLFAKKHFGVFVLRIEDTDEKRSTPEYEKGICDALSWLGMEWDEGPEKGGDYGPYRQSERRDIYEKYIQQLLDKEMAYYCYCTKDELEAQKEFMVSQGVAPKYSGHCRELSKPPASKEPQVIRFRSPGNKIEFDDMVKGQVSFDTSEFGDIVIAKDIKSPLYNLAVVIDDSTMDISHVIRGDEHLSNTPKQILLAKALGLQIPKYAHIPLILAPNRSKLSKRYAETSLLKYKNEGYLPEALVNFLALLGWHPSPSKDEEGNVVEKEIFTIEELIKEFDINRVQKSGAIFGEDKLLWLNREHIRMTDNETIAKLLEPKIKEQGWQDKISPEMLHEVIDLAKERMKTLNDFVEEADLFFELPEYEPELLVWGKDSPEKTLEALSEAYEIIAGDTPLEPSALGEAMQQLYEKYGRGSVLWPLRVAVSGKRASPDPLVIISILGKKESMERISKGITDLKTLI